MAFNVTYGENMTNSKIKLNLDSLKSVFESAYKSTKDEDKRGRFKRAYDTRKDQLSTGITA